MLLVLKLTKHSVLAGADSRNLSFPLRRPGSQLQNQHPVSSQKQTERATQWVIPTMGYRKGNFSASWRDLKKWPDHDAFTSYFYIILPLACMLLFFFVLFLLILRRPNTQTKFSFLQNFLNAWSPSNNLKGKTVKHKGDQCQRGDAGSTRG